jgi:hypothetical protein
MKTRSIVGLSGLVLTLVLMIPVLFFLSRGAVSPNQFAVIAASVLLLVVWTILYVTLVDPLLRRAVGALFKVTIEWRGPSNSISWTPVENSGCILGFFLGLLGYFFIGLWLLPFGAAIALVLWFRH